MDMAVALMDLMALGGGPASLDLGFTVRVTHQWALCFKSNTLTQKERWDFGGGPASLDLYLTVRVNHPWAF